EALAQPLGSQHDFTDNERQRRQVKQCREPAPAIEKMIACRVDRGEMDEQRAEQQEGDDVRDVYRFIKVRTQFGGRAEKVRDEGTKADQEEVRDVRRAALTQQKVDADAEIDQTDERQVKRPRPA